MLATTFDQPAPRSRSEIKQLPTAELPRLVDRILDGRVPVRDPAARDEGPVRPTHSLLALLRRLFGGSAGTGK